MRKGLGLRQLPLKVLAGKVLRSFQREIGFSSLAAVAECQVTIRQPEPGVRQVRIQSTDFEIALDRVLEPVVQFVEIGNLAPGLDVSGVFTKDLVELLKSCFEIALASGLHRGEIPLFNGFGSVHDGSGRAQSPCGTGTLDLKPWKYWVRPRTSAPTLTN